MMRIFTLIDVHLKSSKVIVVKELIGEERAANVERLAIALYTKVSLSLTGFTEGF